VERLRPRKRLGQNFLRARWVSRLFAEWACRYRRLAEIGPGLGALTREVLARCPHSFIYLVELDARLLDELRHLRLLSFNYEVVRGDALHPPLRMDAVEALYGSIPYNITGPLLSEIALQEEPRPAMLLLQREVATRIAAKPGTAAYGRLTVLIQLTYRVELGPTVPPSAFVPRPRVFSQIVYLEPREGVPRLEERRRVEKVTRCMFSQRRRLALKVAGRCLRVLPESVRHVLRGRRVYELTPEDFLLLSAVASGSDVGRDD